MEDLCNLCRPAVPDSKWPRDWGSHSFPGRKPNIMHYLVHWLQDWDFMMQERTARQTLGNFNVKHSCHGLACQRQTAVTCHSISSHCVSPCVYKRHSALLDVLVPQQPQSVLLATHWPAKDKLIEQYIQCWLMNNSDGPPGKRTSLLQLHLHQELWAWESQRGHTYQSNSNSNNKDSSNNPEQNKRTTRRTTTAATATANSQQQQ